MVGSWDVVPSNFTALCTSSLCYMSGMGIEKNSPCLWPRTLPGDVFCLHEVKLYRQRSGQQLRINNSIGL